MATLSAVLNQRFVANPLFALLSEQAADLGAMGVNVGHTGTVVGLLFDADDPDAMKHTAAASVELERMMSSTVLVEIAFSVASPDK